MGSIQSKKDGVVGKYELSVDLQHPIKSQLLGLTNWSFADIKQAYDIHCRKGDCPFIDFFTFHKLMPFTTEVSRHVFASFASGSQYINIFELICILIVVGHNNYRKKLQFMFTILDLTHQNRLTNREMILLFESILNGFCRITGQARPRYEQLTRYTIERFIRVNSLEALEKVVTYRRLIEEVEGNTDCFQLFKRFDQEIYGFFKQESYLFRVQQYQKYEAGEIERIYRIIKKANQYQDYEEVELVEENRRFRLENRKTECIRHLLEEKQEKFKKTVGSLKTRSSSVAAITSRLPTLQRQSFSKASSPRIQQKSPTKTRDTLNSKVNEIINVKLNPKLNQMKTLSSLTSKNPNRTKVLILNGKIENKEDVFETISYFKGLSGNKSEIKLKQFALNFEKKAFVKKQVGSLFHYFDAKRKGEVNFEDFLRSYYHNIRQSEIDVIKEWLIEYKTIHEADLFDISEHSKPKQKKVAVELPKNALLRIDQIFNSIDRGRKGHLVIEDLKKSYSTGFSIKELEEMIKQFGKNGKIYKEEFIRLTLPEGWTIEGTPFVGA